MSTGLQVFRTLTAGRSAFSVGSACDEDSLWSLEEMAIILLGMSGPGYRRHAEHLRVALGAGHWPPRRETKGFISETRWLIKRLVACTTTPARVVPQLVSHDDVVFVVVGSQNTDTVVFV